MKKIILAAAVMAATMTTAAQAEVSTYNNSASDLKCERYQYDTNAFTTPSAAASWFPETLWIDTDNFSKVYGRNQFKFQRQMKSNNGDVLFMQFTYLPKVNLLAVNLNTPSGFKKPNPARYRCN